MPARWAAGGRDASSSPSPAGHREARRVACFESHVRSPIHSTNLLGCRHFGLPRAEPLGLRVTRLPGSVHEAQPTFAMMRPWRGFLCTSSRNWCFYGVLGETLRLGPDSGAETAANGHDHCVGYTLGVLGQGGLSLDPGVDAQRRESAMHAAHAGHRGVASGQAFAEAVDILRNDATARSTGFLRPNSKWSRLLRTQSDHRLWETAVLFQPARRVPRRRRLSGAVAPLRGAPKDAAVGSQLLLMLAPLSNAGATGGGPRTPSDASAMPATGERVEETCPRGSDCGPVRKRRMSQPTPHRLRASPSTLPRWSVRACSRGSPPGT